MDDKFQNIYKKFYTPREELHRHFSGLIYPSDFNMDNRSNNSYGSSIAERIISDWKFDAYCLNKKNNTGRK